MLLPAHLVLIHYIGQRQSLAGAARALGLSPAAVTQQLARLEQVVGAPVVERGSRGAHLTDLGAMLAAEGAEVAGSVARAQELIREHLELSAGRLRVGSLASAAVPVVAEAIAYVGLRHPGADLSMAETGSDAGVVGVRQGDFDIAIVADYGQVAEVEGVVAHPLLSDPFLAVVPERHPLAGCSTPVALSALADGPWVSGAPGRPHRIQQDIVASRFGVVPRVAFETESFEVALAMVAAGIALAVVPRLAWHQLPGTVALDIVGEPCRALVAVTSTRTEHLRLLAPMLGALQETALA